MKSSKDLASHEINNASLELPKGEGLFWDFKGNNKKKYVFIVYLCMLVSIFSNDLGFTQSSIRWFHEVDLQTRY